MHSGVCGRNQNLQENIPTKAPQERSNTRMILTFSWTWRKVTKKIKKTLFHNDLQVFITDYLCKYEVNV